ncbi:hypothetical protein EJ05DRAFT_497145 [Pseudovirgaria hyperparasitica]|uniref:Uncharacterized protein n=1 Tax=Pseudovirgaria hyperparasitica TaxID=470096 RepID=A0A6A6WJ87_9PEZI|nr:uncharacterized protein EJ05DRAFT_497145 [Pseudovirgaria hyperparasitica]KAF2762284.1 hypothetical protein EJ05DRAFT_497145 [Pseudovirgaria hyperparasitica]
MPSDKKRLYIALYARGGTPQMPRGEDKYHWAFIIGPKVETDTTKGRRCHVKESVQFIEGTPYTTWAFEDREISTMPTAMILVRVLIGKVENLDRLRRVFAATPIRAGQDGFQAWNCVWWIQEAFNAAMADRAALGTRLADWERARSISMWYVTKKTMEHRFDGQGDFNNDKIATWDAIENKEIVA